MNPTAERLIAFLRDAGAAELRHAGGRNLLDHLIGTAEILRRWGQPEWLQHAALVHSVYGTEAYRQQLISAGRRTELRELAGERAERTAHLFATTPRRLLRAGTHRWATAETATRAELDALVLLHMANLADQAGGSDGTPASWLVELHSLAELVFDSDAVTPPLFVAQLAAFTPADEAAAREAYRDGVTDTNPPRRVERLALAAARCPVIGEPCVWLAHAAWHAGEPTRTRDWAAAARERLTGLGTNWDKRLTYDDWLTVIERLELAGSARGPAPGRPTIHDPRALYDEVTDQHPDGGPGPLPPAVGRDRFARYMHRLADAPQPHRRILYPDLERRPWWDADLFPLARELRAHASEIRTEVLALNPSDFAPESEPIRRTGQWEVRFFHERGRRDAETCDACPTTARIIEANGALLTGAGLSYVSRMSPGTHIAAHHGPTNLRLRCHLGITVPDGDCAIRVDGEIRRWQDGECLVFDDSFEHEAWNHTDGERIVLIVDLWHPGLSDTEVHLVSGLHRYAAGYARNLDRYWATNARARATAPGLEGSPG